MIWLMRLRYEDAEEIYYTYASKPEATRFVSWPTHQRLADTRAFLSYSVKAWDAGKDFSYAIRLEGTGRLAGSIGALVNGNDVQVGYIVSPSLWGRGIATEALRLMGKMLSKARSEDDRIWTFVDAENKASIRVLEKCGWTCEGMRQQYHAFVNQGNRLKDCLIFRLDAAQPDALEEE
jgi:ribosomal-protein-alanine N-acetyltransferase